MDCHTTEGKKKKVLINETVIINETVHSKKQKNGITLLRERQKWLMHTSSQLMQTKMQGLIEVRQSPSRGDITYEYLQSSSTHDDMKIFSIDCGKEIIDK